MYGVTVSLVMVFALIVLVVSALIAAGNADEKADELRRRRVHWDKADGKGTGGHEHDGPL